ncbi:MAG: agmatinase, partial [Clostridia bacterium]
MLSKNIETFIGCDKEFDEADFVIFGAPFDSTTSYRPGARFGSKAMRGESFGLETYSPYKDKDLLDSNVFDGGDLELCFGNTKRVIDDIKNYELYILNNNKLPIMIGGEHLVTLGGVAAAVEKYGDICIVHFDAHADLREDYLGEKLSHACVMRRCIEIIGEGKVYQFGIRSGEKAEFDYAKTATVMNKFNFNGIDKACKEIGEKLVYLTIDLDVLDSAVFPGTGT